MIGQLASFSQNATMIQFVGGPFDGQSGLYDHDRFDVISFCDPASESTDEYVPAGRALYRFKRTYRWDRRRKANFELSI